MLDARRRLLQSDTYKPLVAELNTLIQPQDTIADLGCGEGFYLAAIAEAHPEIRGFGLDIAKHGIKKAAATYKNPLLEFAVASTYRIPIQSTSTSLALSIFAPFCPQETQRILTPEGRLIRVSPGPTHLCEIKSHLYEKAEVHSKPEPALGFILEYEKQVTWSATLTGGTIVDDLIPMTPLHWQGSTESKEKLREQDLEITFDFYVECFVISANNTDKEN